MSKLRRMRTSRAEQSRQLRRWPRISAMSNADRRSSTNPTWFDLNSRQFIENDVTSSASCGADPDPSPSAQDDNRETVHTQARVVPEIPQQNEALRSEEHTSELQ